MVPSGSGHAREPRGSGRGTTRKHEGTHETYRGRRAWSLGAFTSSAALSARTPMAREELTIFKCLQVQLWYGTPGYGATRECRTAEEMSNTSTDISGGRRHFVTRDLARVSSIAFTLSDSFPHISIDASTSSRAYALYTRPLNLLVGRSDVNFFFTSSDRFRWGRVYPLRLPLRSSLPSTPENAPPRRIWRSSSRGATVSPNPSSRSGGPRTKTKASGKG